MVSVGAPRTRAGSVVAAKLGDGFVGTGRFLEILVDSTRHVVADIARGRFPWREAITQTWFVITVTAIPAILISIPFGVIISIQVGNLTQQIGATSISGAAGGLGVIRQGAPIVAALLLGGAAGSAMTADLGARVIREEISAMISMGVDPVRRLVAPRLFVMVVVGPMLCLLIIFVGVATGYIANVGFQGGTPGSYLASFSAFATPTDLIVAMIKVEIFSVIVAIVSCQRGLDSKTGPKGVADAVNAAVVIGVIAAFGVNVVITQIVAIFIPDTIG